MRVKYRSMDDRTGYPVGKIVELGTDELNRIPFNVYLEAVSEEVAHEEDGKARVTAALEELRALLRSRGLSRLRTERVLENYPSLSALEVEASHAGIDPAIDAFIKENFLQDEQPRKKPLRSRT